MVICAVCGGNDRKYKCSKCETPYCSVACYKAHKDSPECIKQVELQQCAEIKNRRQMEDGPTIYQPSKTEDTVPLDKLEQLKNSETIRAMLHKPHLRNLLHPVDVAPKAWKAIAAAMQEPLFLEFADECLKIVEPTHHESNI